MGYRVLVTVNRYVKLMLGRVSPSQAIMASTGRLYTLTREEAERLSRLALMKPHANIGIGRYAVQQLLPVAEALGVDLHVAARAALILYLGEERVISEYERRGILRAR